MFRTLIAAALGAVMGTALTTGAAFADPCQMGRVGALDVTWANNRALAPVNINGHDVVALIDTGATQSLLFRNAADALGLNYTIVNDRTAHGFGGGARIYSAGISQLTLAGETANGLRLDVIDSEWHGRQPIAMVIGQNLLSSDNIEFDFAAGHLTFYRTRGDCSHTALAYWTEDWSVIDMLPRDTSTHVMVQAQLNGQNMRVLFDTGSPTSLVTLEAAHRLGVSLESNDVQAAGAVGGTGTRALQSWLGRFDSFVIGGEAMSNARLRIVDTHVPGNSHIPFDMILGADFFRTHRVMFAYSQNKVYFVYLGGHVFQTVGPVELPGDAPSEADDAPAADAPPAEAQPAQAPAQAAPH